MATNPSTSKTQKVSTSKTKKQKSKRLGRSKSTSKSKVVIRRLPPNVPEEKFLESVKPWANEETTDWYRFHQGRISKSKNKESIFSRAYFHFKSTEHVLEFHRAYDNHLFVDNKGNETRAVVEFAPFQKLPKEHKKLDSRQGTIETDPDYLAFVESLKAEESTQALGKEPNVALEGGATQLEKLEARLATAAANAAASTVEKPKSTPLLDHLRAMKSGAKSKSPPLKGASKLSPLAILSSPFKGNGIKLTKQQLHAVKSLPIGSKQRRERKKKEKEKERRERAKDKEKLKDQENEREDKEQGQLKSKEKESEKEKERESNRERKERERRKEKQREKERAKMQTAAESLTTNAPKTTGEEKKKITIQQRQKDQIRQIIQRPIPKKEDTLNKPSDSSKDSAKDGQPQTGSTSNASASTPPTPTTPKTPVSPTRAKEHNRRRERDRSKRQSADIKQPVQFQILTKPQASQPNAKDSESGTPTPGATTTASSTSAPVTTSGNTSGSQQHHNSTNRGRGRGFFAKRGRW